MGKDKSLDDPIYDDLKQASPEELLEATIEHYKVKRYEGARWGRFERNGFLNGLRLGFKIAQANGWQEVAPAWLREYQEKKGDKT